MSAAGQSPVLLLVVPPVLLLLLLAWTVPQRVTGQGFRVRSRSGSASVFQQDPKLKSKYQTQLGSAQKLAINWRSQSKKGKLDCTSKGVSCGQDVESTESATTLRIATSPAINDTRNKSHTGGWVLAPTLEDQGDCNSCVGWALAAAAQSAAAAALRVNSNTVPLISVLQLLVCHDQVTGNCRDGWRMEQAVELLTGSVQQRSACVQGFAADKCIGMLSRERLKTFAAKRDCQVQQCNVQLPRGSYSYKKEIPLENMWQIQQHIRDYGASVITRMVLPPGFKKWFDSPQHKRAVYDGPGAGTIEAEKAGDAGINHAIVLAGYNNIEGYWIIWSAWGDWAEGGFARVCFEQLGIGDLDNTYGIVFNPSDPPEPSVKLTPDTNQSNCQWYQVQPGDYVSKVADAVRQPIEQLLQQNVDNITDLGVWLQPGQRLKACSTSGSSSASSALSVAPAGAVTSETQCINKNTQEVRWKLASAMSVPASETPSRNRWEYFHTTGFNVWEAEDVCNQLRGHLVTVDSNRTNQMLYDKFVARWPLARQGIWIGLRSYSTTELPNTQSVTDRSNWYWRSGAKIGHQNWGGCRNVSWRSSAELPTVSSRQLNARQLESRNCATLAGPESCDKSFFESWHTLFGASPYVRPKPGAMHFPGGWNVIDCAYRNTPFVCEFALNTTKRTNQVQITVGVEVSATAPDGKLWACFQVHVTQPAA